MSRPDCETCETCHKVMHKTFRAAQRVARNTGKNNRNDKRHFRPYRCHCGGYVVGTADIFYVRSDTYLRNQRKGLDDDESI